MSDIDDYSVMKDQMHYDRYRRRVNAPLLENALRYRGHNEQD